MRIESQYGRVDLCLRMSETETNAKEVVEKLNEAENSESKTETEIEEEEEETPILDLSNYLIKPDHFDGIHVLDDVFENLRELPTFEKFQGFLSMEQVSQLKMRWLRL